MFSRLIKLYLYNSFLHQFHVPKRYEAMAKEMWYAMGIFFPYIVIPMLVIIFSQQQLGSVDLLQPFTYFGYVIFGMIALVLINKDYFSAQSPVNRLLGFKVIDIKTLEPASKLKCMLRNITAVFWPIEIPFLLFSPQRRLGDLIAGTKLIVVEPTDPELIIEEVRHFRFDKEAGIVLLFSLSVVGLFAIASSIDLMQFLFQ